MERYRLSVLVKDIERGGDIDVVIAADAQRALDAERERVKELEEWQRVVVGTGTDQEAVVRMAATEYTKTAVQCWKDENAKLTAKLATLQARCAHLDVLLRDEYLPKLDVVAVQRSIADRDRRIDALEREVEKLDDDKETLQAQLAAMTESRDAWRLAQECSEKAYMSLATQIPSERYDYDPVNLALLDGAKEQERIGRKQIADLQAQLRQVEGQSKQQAEEAVIVFAKYTTLRQLVEAILLADERGQGLPFKEAMDAAAKAINWNSLPPTPRRNDHE